METNRLGRKRGGKEFYSFSFDSSFSLRFTFPLTFFYCSQSSFLIPLSLPFSLTPSSLSLLITKRGRKRKKGKERNEEEEEHQLQRVMPDTPENEGKLCLWSNQGRESDFDCHLFLFDCYLLSLFLTLTDCNFLI